MTRVTVEHCIELWAPRCARLGALDEPGRSGTLDLGTRSTIGYTTLADGLLLDYTRDGRRYSQTVQVVYSSIPRSARRAWWLCPECGRRCAGIYLSPYARTFACRLCRGLVYRVQATYTPRRWRVWGRELARDARMMARW
jgi:hypothetical protein